MVGTRGLGGALGVSAGVAFAMRGAGAASLDSAAAFAAPVAAPAPSATQNPVPAAPAPKRIEPAGMSLMRSPMAEQVTSSVRGLLVREAPGWNGASVGRIGDRLRGGGDSGIRDLGLGMAGMLGGHSPWRVGAALVLLAAGAAHADHGGPLRSAPMDPVTVGVLAALFTLAVGVLIALVARLLLRRPPPGG